MKRIFNQTLSEYCGKDYYPWHMPGHKRQTSLADAIPTLGMGNQLDVTEVPGLDNLNAPEASIAESERELTRIWKREVILSGKWQYLWNLNCDFCVL